MSLRAKRHDRLERPVVWRLWINLRRATFTIFFSFAADGSFTADGGLLQPTGCVKDNTSQDHFRSVNLYKEFAYRSEIELIGTATPIELTTRCAERKSQQRVK